jgi:hypothetical protein
VRPPTGRGATRSAWTWGGRPRRRRASWAARPCHLGPSVPPAAPPSAQRCAAARSHPVQLLRTDRHSCVAHTLLLWCVAAQEEDGFLDNAMVLYGAVALLAILAFLLLACSLLTKSNYPYIVFGAVFINIVTIIIGETRGGKLVVKASLTECTRTWPWSWDVGTSLGAGMAWLKWGDIDVDALTGGSWVTYGTVLAIAMTVWGVYGIVAICFARKDRNCPMAFFVLVLFLVIVVQTIGFSIALVFIKDSCLRYPRATQSVPMDDRLTDKASWPS